jgi:cyanophycinase-like exopeptidase
MSKFICPDSRNASRSGDGPQIGGINHGEIEQNKGPKARGRRRAELMSKKYTNWRKKANNDRVKRRCFKCDEIFIARGRFNRICPKCSETNRAYIDVARYRFVQ